MKDLSPMGDIPNERQARAILTMKKAKSHTTPKPDQPDSPKPTSFTLDDLDLWWSTYKTLIAYQSSPSIPKALLDLRQFLQNTKKPKSPK